MDTPWSRRRVLAGLLLLPPAVAGCALGRASGPTEPDPLIALADAARADAALAAAAVAADQALAAALQPLVEARTQHAAALDTEIARLSPDRPTPTPVPPPAPTGRPGRAEVQRAVLASGRAAGEVALGMPPDRVGLVASVAACCNTYAEVLA
jgi:HAMP domain-containing protein